MMQVRSSLSFDWTAFSASMAVLAISTAIAFAVVACQRTGWRRSTVVLESVRLAAVVFASLLLGGPQWVETIRPQTRPVVAVLVDDSASMTTRDVLPNRGSDAISRQDAVAPFLKPATWNELQDRADVRIVKLSEIKPVIAPETENSGESGTDLATAISEMATSTEHLLGLVLASDGDWNMGDAPMEAAERLRSMGVPLFAVPIGSRTRLPDVELVSFDVPTFAIAGKQVRIPFSIDSSLPRDHAAVVTMRSSTGEESKRDLRIAAMGRTSETIEWSPADLGNYTLTLTVPSMTAEIRQDNNEISAPIQVRQEKLRVLVIESLPRWEYRYLRNALSRDPGVEVSCLLLHPGLDKRGGGNADYVKEFPSTKEELAKFDVVFLGDVGIDDEQLTVEQCSWLAGLVREQASGLVFLPGWLGNQFGLLETELADLIPVTLNHAQVAGWGSRTAQHFELTSSGNRSLLTKLADTPDENLQVWENLPGFQWTAPVLAAKPGTETLAVHSEMSNQYGRMPLLVTRTIGAGKVLFMATDGAWRWRKGVEDLYHYRFWGQVVRWMAYQRNMVQGETMRLYYSPEQPQVRQTVSLNANVMERSGEPLSQGTVTMRVLPPSGDASTIRFESIGEDWGAFSARWTPKQAGEHRLTLTCDETKQSLETTVLVQGLPLEQIGKPARPEVLEEIARITGGQVLRSDQAADVVKWLSALPDPPPTIRRVALWSHPVVAGSFILLLAAFWVGRKGVGLI